MKEDPRILFIAWDNPKSNYLEGLFAPIFREIQRESRIRFHIIQFSWASPTRIEYLKDLCKKMEISYEHINVDVRPLRFGKQLAVLRGIFFILRYIQVNQIGIVMPRSTVPAQVVLILRRLIPNLKIVFDADGLPIEERVDFANLKRGTIRYRILKFVEGSIIRKADLVLTRTQRSIDYLSASYDVVRSKFVKVVNGRCEEQFIRSDPQTIKRLRAELGIRDDSFVGVYCGSVGPQYGIEQMLEIHRSVIRGGLDLYLLVLTNDPVAFSKYGSDSDRNIIVKSVEHSHIPDFLSVADFAYAIRKATFSMQGVAPIKLGEYLLVGLPVIASAGIGDTEELLADKSFAFILNDYEKPSLQAASLWITQLKQKLGPTDHNRTREFGITEFGLGRSVETYLDALKRLFQE